MSDDFDRPREACGVVGVWTRRDASLDAARLLFFSLYALQHRGQESAGMVVSDGNVPRMHKGMGLVSQVFREEDLSPMTGHYGIGHNRYSTTGDSILENCQPLHLRTLHGPLSVGHNGNLTNAEELKRHLLERGVGLISTSDTELIAQFLASPAPFTDLSRPYWTKRLSNLMDVAKGAYSLVIMTGDAIYAMRDPLGLRPLCLGHLRLQDGSGDGPLGAFIAASESSALLTIGAKYLRDVRPGEIVRLDDEGITTVREPALQPHQKPSLCVFEYVYFARPDSKMDGQTVQVVRQRMGRRLAREAPADADLVFAVPDSSVPSAMAYAEALRLPYTEGLIKNRYIGRTFIKPSARMRQDAVRLKYNALRENLEGKRVVLIDDSIVRGTTMGPIVRLVRDAGKAREVHVRIASPPIRNPCFMGVDLATHDQLIAHRMSVEEIRRHVGADSLAYLSLEGLHTAVNEGLSERCGHCDACFSGDYPVDISGC